MVKRVSWTGLLALIVIVLFVGTARADECMGDRPSCGGGGVLVPPPPPPSPPPTEPAPTPVPAPTPAPPPPSGEPQTGYTSTQELADYGEDGPEQIDTIYRTLQALDGTKCYGAKWSDRNGHFFYVRKVFQQVNWCARDGVISSWSAQQWVETGLYCVPATSPETIRLAGGVGATFVTLMSRAAFTCNLRLLPDPTDWVDVDVRYGADGRMTDV